MKQEQLEERLETYFKKKETQVVASGKLVYKARLRYEGARHMMEVRERFRLIIYAVLLHFLWTLSMVVGTVFFKGTTEAVYVMVWNLVMSIGLIVGGCIALPQFIKQPKEGER